MQTELMTQPHALAKPDGVWPSVAPACDIYENPDEILILADMPGVGSDALIVNLEKGELVVSARRDVPVDDGSFLDKEYRTCDFRRRFSVPGGIDTDKIAAELKDGVLWLHLPKSDGLKPRRISVTAG